MSGDKHKSEESQVMLFLERLDSKVEKLTEKFDEKMSNVDRTLIKQEATLEKHVYRTDLAEKNIELVRSQVSGVERELVPIKKHVILVENTFKVLGVVCAVGAGALGIVVTVIKIYAYLKTGHIS